MGTVNSVMIIGNLGQDPELRFTGTGKAVCNMSIATTHKPKDQPEQTEWHRVVAWDKNAENCAKYLKKGRSVCVQGRLATRTWDKDGIKRFATEIMAEKITFMGAREPEGAPAAAPAKPAKPAAQSSNEPDDFGPGQGDDNVPW